MCYVCFLSSGFPEPEGDSELKLSSAAEFQSPFMSDAPEVTSHSEMPIALVQTHLDGELLFLF